MNRKEIRYRDLMESSLLIRYLGDSPKLRIIDYMLYFPLNDFTKKEILEEVGMSKQTFYKHFDDLIKEGIVTATRKIARATLYRVNRQHPVVKKLDELVKESSLKIAEQELEKMEKPVPVKLN
ncbi:MAG: winged helix-turn-helix transcriptional regulator [archaeon]|nr:winged helix-turn-helix transcriptional regulator [archaeon]